jgi:hypothetical protein
MALSLSSLTLPLTLYLLLSSPARSLSQCREQLLNFNQLDNSQAEIRDKEEVWLAKQKSLEEKLRKGKSYIFFAGLIFPAEERADGAEKKARESVFSLPPQAPVMATGGPPPPGMGRGGPPPPPGAGGPPPPPGARGGPPPPPGAGGGPPPPPPPPVLKMNYSINIKGGGRGAPDNKPRQSTGSGGDMGDIVAAIKAGVQLRKTVC